MEITEAAAMRQFMAEIADPSHVGEVRRLAVECAKSIGIDETDCGRIAIAVTELASNLVKHAQEGKILLEPLSRNGASGLRILSLDKGPGISNVSDALRDGYSTFGSSGNGLGAVRRLSTVFDLYSMAGLGTCILAECWGHKRVNSPESISLGVVSLALRGETVCGDGWGTRVTADRSFLMVVDGLGHGAFAAEAAREAERVLAESRASSAVEILRDCHDALKKTRGAAAAVAEISPEKKMLKYAGVGNISATVIDPQGRRGIASYNGTLGHQLHHVQEFTVPWNENSILIMHSDGMRAKWDLNEYRGLGNKHPSIIAAMLYRDFRREIDDVTVMVAKNG
jgi:anti-sigma regulatory factor (Ser/Thr protein kinase)